MMLKLSKDKLETLVQSQAIERISVEELFEFFRREEAVQKFIPDGIYQTDPRDDAVIVYNSARAKRPHGYNKPETATGQEKTCPVCEGNTTKVIDFTPLSQGFTFINKNMFPMLYPDTLSANPQSSKQSPTSSSGTAESRRAYGIHLLQWTSSEHEKDWHNMPLDDCRVVMQRLAAVEKKLLLESGDLMPESEDDNNREQQTAGYVSIIKNCGPLVGGSLPHGHQQIAYSNVMPRRFAENRQFMAARGETLSAYLLRENPAELTVMDYGQTVLLTPYFMRRPYASMLIVKDTSKQYLHELSEQELSEVTRGWSDAIRAMLRIMPQIGREPAYNVVTHNGPGAGLYFEFLPYTQETGGYEHLGLWICQNTPAQAAETLRTALNAET
ncbi:MAG: hypothetical protein R6V56_08940 [Lentisphaeria bacterium]